MNSLCSAVIGAGKTTLLNALSGRATYAKVSGSVTMDGRALRSDDLNYVPQFDDLNEFFTPREVLHYMSLLKVNLRYPRSVDMEVMSAYSRPPNDR